MIPMLLKEVPWGRLALIVAIFSAGWTVNQWRLGNEIKQIKLDLANETIRANNELAAKQKAQKDRNHAVADSIIVSMELERAQGKVITREVIRYVQSPDAGQCRMPDGWVRLHEIAAGSDPAIHPEAPGGAADPATGFTDADVIQVIVDNYQSCREDMARLAGWQQWYREVVAE